MDNKEWYIEAFQEWYSIVYYHRDDKEAQEQVEFACSELGLTRKSRVLDLCCGYGRHLKFLSERLSFVVGLDLSLYLLREAQGNNSMHNTCFLRGDVRYLPFCSQSFNAVLNLFTSFGYFEEHNDNLKQLEQISIILKKKGLLLFDYFNPLLVQKIKNIETEKIYKSYIIKENRCYDETNKILKKHICIYSNDLQLKKSYTENVKVYNLNELFEMFLSCHLTVKKIYGSYKKESYNSESPRLIIIGEKNE